jgi:hypothetical protein
MAHTDGETESVSPAEESAEMPLPADPKTIFLGGLFALALLATAYVAGEIVLPMVFAFTLKLLLQPFFRILERRSLASAQQFRDPLQPGRPSCLRAFRAFKSG